jgi:hypothetical protein
MNSLRRRHLVLAAIGSAMLGNAIAAEPGAVREIAWDELVPKDWDPMKEIGATDPSQLKDGDPRAAALMKKMQAAFDNAPASPAMDGAQVKTHPLGPHADAHQPRRQPPQQRQPLQQLDRQRHRAGASLRARIGDSSSFVDRHLRRLRHLGRPLPAALHAARSSA